MRHSYEQLIREATILPAWIDRANSFKLQYEKNHARYQEAWAHCNVPSIIIACINTMENGGRFDRHIHNGDALTGRTHQVPAGRPKVGNPPFSWLESVVDCLVDLKKLNLHPWGEDFSKDLEKLEAFNGWGYRNKQKDSPYIVNGSTFTVKGKYVADGVYDPNAESKQLGILPMLIVTRYFKQ